MFKLTAGRYTLRFKDAGHADRFQTRIQQLWDRCPTDEAHKYASQIAWRYYALPVLDGTREVADTIPIPWGLWMWMEENWV